VPERWLGRRDRVLDGSSGDERDEADQCRHQCARDPAARREHGRHHDPGAEPCRQHAGQRLRVGAGQAPQRQRTRHRRPGVAQRDAGEQTQPADAAGHHEHRGEHGDERAEPARGHRLRGYGASLGVT
jgi:hypothetical protein